MSSVQMEKITVGKLVFTTVFQLVAFTWIKSYFYMHDLFSIGIYMLIYWAVAVVVATAMVRRLGVLSLFEALLAFIVWFALDIFADLLVTSALAGTLDIFFGKPLWSGYLLMGASIFLFHKKRHLHIRKHMSHH